MGWSWRQTCGKLSKQDLVAVLVGHRTRLCFAYPTCCAASCENGFSSLAPDSSRSALPLAHILIANPLENFISGSSFHLWCGFIPSPTTGIEMRWCGSGPAYWWPSPPALLGFVLQKGSLEGPEEAVHLFPLAKVGSSLWKKAGLRLAEVSR